MQAETIPVVLFAYTRPKHLQRVLECLKKDHIPLLYAFSDGPRNDEDIPHIIEVRQILNQVDWCETRIIEREENLGLGNSIITGVKEVFSRHEMIIVFEDDLICVPGTYQYFCAALQHYRKNPRVMSITGWTHPLVTPGDVSNQPYFDGRAECWSWGSWARSWQGMEESALVIMQKCKERGLDINKYGYDLAEMARGEKRRNIWAVRFLYLHILREGLCMRPPWSLVEHEGYDWEATNSKFRPTFYNDRLAACPPIPPEWPEPIENPQCALLWKKVFRKKNLVRSVFRRLIRLLKNRPKSGVA